MTTPTIDQFKSFAHAIAADAIALVAMRAFAQHETERVRAYIAPIVARYAFTVSAEMDPDHAGEVITDSELLYLALDEARMKQFYAECDEAHKAHGFTGKPGYWPNLIAGHEVIKAEYALLQKASAIFGVKFENTYGDNRKQALDLLIGLGVKAAAEGGR